jgi:hypothetical protein
MHAVAVSSLRLLGRRRASWKRRMACFAQLAGDQVGFVLEDLLYADVVHFHLCHLPSQEIIPAMISDKMQV